MGPNPNTVAWAASAASESPSPTTHASRVRSRSVANIVATSLISLWSRCRLRMTESAGRYWTREPSLSSASITRRSELPWNALPHSPSRWSATRSPPVMTEGPRPLARRISKIMATTVDLPLVPATATVRCAATKCASSPARWMTGRRRARAAATSGTCSSTAVETTRAAQSSRSRPARGWRCPSARGCRARPPARRGRTRGRSRSRARRSSPGTGRARSCRCRRVRCSGSDRRPPGRGSPLRTRPQAPGSPAAMNTASPSATRSNSSTTSAFARRTQPCEAGRPSWSSWLVPCR